MTTQIRIGISTCPNDTFAFHGLMTRAVDWRGLDFKFELIDIQQLNNRLFQHEFDIAKTSFHAALLLADDYVVLPSGSALGFGVGPLLLSAVPGTLPANSNQTTLCPGEHTTATLLFKLFHANTTRIQHVVFSDIMPRLQNADADFGVCIHEGRFTWQDHGLGMVEDLGVRWETETDCPLPLGGIVASRQLDEDTIAAAQTAIRDSVEYGLANRDATFPTMRRYAQEFDDDVLMQHVDLYVNDWTVNLGITGQAALHELGRRAHEIGLVGDTNVVLQVFGS
jgi:1,4-dihydroxy-6-naphthoate synthase